MAVNIGVNIQRSPNRINQALREAGVNGQYPKLLFDFDDEYYLTNGSSKTFANAMTFARAGNATMVDSDGKIKWAPHNIFPSSEDISFNPSGNATLTDGYEDPAGTDKAVLLESNGSGNFLRLATAITVKENTEYKWNVFHRNLIGTAKIGAYDVSNGSNIGDVDITATSSTWELTTFSFTTPAGCTSIYVYYARDFLNSSSSVECAFPHLYRSDLGGMVNNPDRGDSYVPTTSSAVYLPRRGHHKYNGDQWVNKGILVESKARTNLVTYSNDFSQWTVSNATKLLNQITAPDGTTTGAKIVDNTVAQNHYIESPVLTLSSGAVTGSVYLKAGELTFARVRLNSTSAQVRAWFNLATGVVDSVDVGGIATIEDAGNGWYRCSLTEQASTSTASDAKLQVFLQSAGSFQTSYTGDGISGLYVWGGQLENPVSTPSSYIPTNGSSVTRAAETVTVPYANLPWPTPTYIGDELVTNGTFDTDTSGWSANVSASLSVVSQQLKVERIATGYGQGYQAVTVTAGKVYEVSAYGKLESGATGWILIGDTSSTQKYVTQGVPSGGASYTFYIVPDSTNIKITGQTHNVNIGDAVILDNISVREINPLSVSIAVKGEITYADSDLYEDANFFRWYEASTDRLDIRLDGNSTNVGRPVAVMAANNVQDTSIFGFSEYIADGAINQPYNLAGRYGSTFIQLSVDGSNATANTTPTSLPDLSATNLQLAFKYNGTISEFRIWDKDIGDTGIAEATKPSLEPSLSLTFDGQPSSFTNTGLTL